MYTYIHMYMHIYIYICVYTCTYTNICILKNSSQIKILQFLLWGIDPHPSSSRLYIYKHLCIHIHTHIYMYTYTYIHLNIYTYTYIYIHVCVHVCVYSKILLEKVADVDETIPFTFGRLCEPVRVFVVPQHLHLHS